jgi:hypothetical protein
MAFARHHEGEISRKHGIASDTRLSWVELPETANAELEARV